MICPLPSVLIVIPFTTSMDHAAVAPEADAVLSLPDAVDGV